MPQMSPLSWLTLLAYFTAALVIVNILTFYSASPESPVKTISIKKTLKSWKW
uniref:ATP synthase F0 subunit 8 n=1 Tax=Chlorophila portschinski TaxID=2969964 RepID=UPI002176AF01|nr:ATP synthase F0 subunit 8 [Chlorophila portschinski]UUL71655.1 ATP synthase F0 subunit 8 [Chlorophila portschinski]